MNNYLNTPFDLSNKNVFIIGGAGLIGIRSCEILSSAGANVHVIDLVSKDRFLDKYYKIVKGKNAKLPNFYQIDISSEEQVVDFVNKYNGTIDVLINHAHFKGDPEELIPFSPFFNSTEDYPFEYWSKTLNANLNGLFITSKHFGNRMIKQKSGILVNTSSTYGLVSPNEKIYGNSGINNPISYATSKAAIINFTRYLATHWAKYNIRANCLIPGGIKNTKHSDEFVHNYIEKVPLGRMANDKDYQCAVLFLSSRASSYMTGSSLVIDGGWTAW